MYFVIKVVRKNHKIYKILPRVFLQSMRTVDISTAIADYLIQKKKKNSQQTADL